jgi:multidrug efflux pump
VQAALNAAVADLPGDLPNLPNFRKANPNATPILILALTSDTRPASAVYDIADTVIASGCPRSTASPRSSQRRRAAGDPDRGQSGGDRFDGDRGRRVSIRMGKGKS